MPTPLEISLVVTAHRAGPLLSACLDSAATLVPAPREVIVAIDGGDESVVREAEQRGFRTVCCGGSRGVSATRNAGARAATGKIVAFVDSDVLLQADHIAQVIRGFETNPGASAVFGSYDEDPAASGLVSGYRNLLHHYTHQRADREARTFWAGSGAVRLDAFLAVGGFDESYRLPSVEDIELGYRLRRAGHRIRLVPEWQVKHLKKWRLRDLIFTDVGRRAIPWTKLLRREERLDNDLNIDHLSRLSAALVCGGFTLLAAGLFWRPGFFIGASFLAAATALNWPFYRFLLRKNGWLFAFASVPLHWLYFIGATLGFALGHLGRK